MQFRFCDGEGGFGAAAFCIVGSGINILTQAIDFLLYCGSVDIIYWHCTFGENSATLLGHLGKATSEEYTIGDRTPFKNGEGTWPNVRYYWGVPRQDAEIAFLAWHDNHLDRFGEQQTFR